MKAVIRNVFPNMASDHWTPDIKIQYSIVHYAPKMGSYAEYKSKKRAWGSHF